MTKKKDRLKKLNKVHKKNLKQKRLITLSSQLLDVSHEDIIDKDKGETKIFESSQFILLLLDDNVARARDPYNGNIDIYKKYKSEEVVELIKPVANDYIQLMKKVTNHEDARVVDILSNLRIVYAFARSHYSKIVMVERYKGMDTIAIANAYNQYLAAYEFTINDTLKAIAPFLQNKIEASTCLDILKHYSEIIDQYMHSVNAFCFSLAHNKFLDIYYKYEPFKEDTVSVKEQIDSSYQTSPLFNEGTPDNIAIETLTSNILDIESKTIFDIKQPDYYKWERDEKFAGIFYLELIVPD
jgi:hypothetical protein